MKQAAPTPGKRPRLTLEVVIPLRAQDLNGATDGYDHRDLVHHDPMTPELVDGSSDSEPTELDIDSDREEDDTDRDRN